VNGCGRAVHGKRVIDEKVLRALYDEHAGAVLRYATQLTGGDRQRAEDVVQEVLLRAWQHPEAVMGQRVRRWLFTVTRNLVIDGQRAKRARPHEVGEAALGLCLAADDVDRALESWGVATALATLRPNQRRVLFETYYRGSSVAEAAAELGIPAGTVKSRTFYALKALRLALEERGLAP
jgi:RNA polymerase sigma-70 factor, ECF subfamily